MEELDARLNTIADRSELQDEGVVRPYSAEWNAAPYPDEIDETEEVIREYINKNIILANNLRQQNYQPIHGGSIPSHAVINRDRETAHQNFTIDYFADNPCFGEDMFHRRYQMSRSLFLCIVDAVKDHDYYFQQQSDELGRMGLSQFQKVTVVFRMLAYDLPVDATDKYVNISESTAIESMTKFCHAMVEIFAERYLRTPNANDIARLLYIGKKYGFPRMLGSLDCMHWKWKIYLTAWSGQYAGHSGSPTIILETVVDYDL
ncbi:uncharacterized protein LOC109838376 [Asparagus officinalis]|uniref:uncharacterized protein LOC109838376 n=1 Tax=Asparagus officinalis TaxID=4686 RepID=UPI00098E2DE1|nr:uncharacterized protein LOC109838376 [Asparagus officinalis]